MIERWKELLLKIGIKEENLETFAKYSEASSKDLGNLEKSADLLSLEIYCLSKYQDRVKVFDNGTIIQKYYIAYFKEDLHPNIFQEFVQTSIFDWIEDYLSKNEFLNLSKNFIYKLQYEGGKITLTLNYLN